MALTTAPLSPLVSATKFDVSPVSVADETDYSGQVGAGTGRGILGSSMPKGRAIRIVAHVGALTGAPDSLKVGLGVCDDADGGATLDFVTGAATEFTTVAAGRLYEVEVPLSYVSDMTKYYSACVALKDSGGATAALIGTVSTVLDPTYV